MLIKIPGMIPIRIYSIFWILALFIAYSSTGAPMGSPAFFISIVTWIGIILVSVVIHEYGHALTAIAFGQKAHIDLIGFGGLTHRHGPKLKLWQEFLVILNGPLAGFLFGCLCFVLYRYLTLQSQTESWFQAALYYSFVANFFWTVINLFPVQPLDGGRLLSVFLEGVLGVKGVKLALFLSILFAGICGVLFFAVGQLLMGALFFMFAYESFIAWQNSLKLTEQDHDTVLQRLLKDAEKELHQGDPEVAWGKLQHVREISKSGVIYVTATELMAEMLNHQGKFKEGYELLAPVAKNLSPTGLRLEQQMAYHSGQWSVAADLGKRVYQNFPEYDIALVNSLCYALLADVKPAVGWLQRAINDGLPNLRAILTKSEFDQIRRTPQFQDLIKQVQEQT